MFLQLTNPMVLAKQKSMHLVLKMVIFTRTLVTYARTNFKGWKEKKAQRCLLTCSTE